MQRIILSFILSVVLLLSFSQGTPAPDHASLISAYKQADAAYREAEHLADLSENDSTLTAAADKRYQDAVQLYLRVLPGLQQAGNDSLLFLAQVKTGKILQGFDSLAKAKSYYLSALSLREKGKIPDSLCLEPVLFTGRILYGEEQLDSAYLYLKRAEQISDKYNDRLESSERVYNLLGVIHYEKGDYRQAVNYFEKALSLVSPLAKSLQVNYKINIASALMKIDEDVLARAIYEDLLRLNVYNNEIYHKLGLISLKENNYTAAVGYLRKVEYVNSKKSIDLYLNYAMAFSGAGQPDSAEQYLYKAVAENLKWNGHRKNISNGLLLKFRADELAGKQQYKDALQFYQQAIVQFDNDYNELNETGNPVQFSGVFSYINLFNTLTAKAAVFEKIYELYHKVENLEAALDAYRSAFNLADYVERTYNSDEARLFLGRIKHEVHSRPIDIGLRLYNLTQKKEYLEEVYLFDQRNKASVLSFNVKLQEVYDRARAGNPLFTREASIRSAITRLSLKAANATDSTQLTALNAAIRDKEIELEKIRDTINTDPLRQQLIAAEKIPTITRLQRQLDNTTALLSYHLSENELLVLFVTNGRFDYYRAPVGQDFFRSIESLKQALYHASPEERYSGSTYSRYLYQQLISPLLPSLAQIKRLVIIPDDELHYLPFEALENGDQQYLVRQFAVQYQYSTALLGDNVSQKPSSSVLSFAPYAATGFKDSALTFSPLPASGGEVKEINGKTLTDSSATKQAFLDLSNHFNVVHLATHAIADNNDPERSFISFYPGNNASRLYAKEIYDLRLDTTSLVILSACETGSGKLVKGEGLMSLSRAFAYAGCPSIITSLWKAEDNTTAFICQRLHYYLSRNETKDKALQMAKLDFLNSSSTDPRFKTPNYWAHLVLIGDYEPDHKRSNWPYVALSIVAIMLGYYFLKQKTRQ